MKEESPQIRLQEILSVSDLSDLFVEMLLENLTDPHHMRFSRHSNKEHSLSTCRDFIENLLQSNGRYFQIFDSLGQSFLGSLTIRPRSELECEAGILVFKSAVGRGVGSAVWMELPNILKKDGYNKLYAGCHRDNIAMRALMRRLDMTRLPTEKSKFIGDWQDNNVYFILDLTKVANT